MRVGGLFSGIGGFELGLVRAGFEIAWMVEIDDFCQKVLRKHAPTYWPNAEIFGDIKDVGKHNLESVDLLCGGFPCQPFSQAGKRRDKEDDRYLWPEMLRVIRELSPRWIVGENVAGFISMELASAFTDLETEGYQVEAFVLPANAVDAPHRRDRIWIMAYPSSRYGRCLKSFNSLQGTLPATKRQKSPPETNGSSKVLAYPNGSNGNGRAGNVQMGRERRQETVKGNGNTRGNEWQPEPSIRRVVNGIPNRLDRLKSLGNAVVPQISEILGRMILEIEATQ